MTKRWPAGFLLFALTALAVAQSQPAETLPGFAANSTLEAHGIDNVNLFNGDPGIAIPLGPQYPLGPGNSWQLAAYYSGKLWFFDTDPCNIDIPPSTSVRHAYLRGYPTIGAGWTLHVGYINTGGDSDDQTTAGYYSPDGARHEFDTVQTTDGSHLRVTAHGPPAYYTVEFPDGTVHEFRHAFIRPRPVSGTAFDFTDVTWNNRSLNVPRYGLTSIRDAFGTTLLTVDYVSNASPPDANSWKIQDINLNPGTPQYRQIVFNWGAPQGSYAMWDALSSITFPTATGSLTASFTYTSPLAPSPVINRTTFDNSLVASFNCGNPGILAVHLLSSLTLSAPSISPISYSFSYHLTSPGVPDAPRDGVLEHFALPTGGTVDYAYAKTTGYCLFIPGFQSCPDPETGGMIGPSDSSANPCTNGPLGHGAFVKYWDHSAAVIARTESDPITGLNATTSYDRSQLVPEFYSGGLPIPDDCGVTRAVVVTRLSGNGSGQFATRHVFHVEVDPGEGGGIELARRIYPDANAAGTPVRAIVNCYENDTSLGIACGFRNGSGQISDYHSGSNPRLQASVSWYGANPTGGESCQVGSTPPCVSSVSSNYNSTAGKYGTVTLSSSLAANVRSTVTNWTPLTSPLWLLNVYDARTTTEGSSVADQGFEFDSQGFLRGFLTYDSARQWAAFTCRYGDGAGNVHQEFSATASFPFHPPSSMCSTNYPSMPSVGTNNDAFGRVYGAHPSGLPVSSQWVNGTSPASWFNFDVTRDPATGLVTFSRNTARVQTGYTYDALSRLTQIAPPPPEISTVTSYDSATQTTISRDGGTGLTTWQRFRSDGFGRPLREIRLMPKNTYAVRSISYDTAGHASFRSEWTDCPDSFTCATTATPSGTAFSSFDAFGRPQAIRRADGAATTVSYADGAASTRTVTTNNINGSCNGACAGGSPAVTTYTYDIFGRLTSVQEPGDPPATYSYDVNGKLTFVSQGSGAQTRTFDYDPFGFLRSETTPERGTVTNSAIGSLGNLITEALPDGVVISRTYDFAGRLTGITSNEGGSRVYLQNTYNNSIVDSSLGKLTGRTAWNYSVLPTPSVADTYVYGGLNGRISQKTTQVAGSSSLVATQAWQYNSLGLIAQHYHPQTLGAPARFAVSTVYDAGLPAAEYVNGIPAVTSITYRPSGTLGSYTTGLFPVRTSGAHRVTTTLSADASLLPRPAQIYTEDEFTGARLFDTQSYSYDGAGNIVSMGTTTDSFAYDLKSRLVSATLAGAGSQSYTYDLYGNLLTKAGVTFCSGTCANNRVTGATYDGRGNLTGHGTNSYSYDGLDRMIFNQASTPWYYLYDGNDERAARIPPSGSWTFTLRDEFGRITSEFAGPNPVRDNVYLGSTLAASYTSGGVDPVWTFYSADHLGTPRLITSITGTTIETRRYWPFGEVLAGATSQRLRFAGMEQDPEAGPNSDRYYDHSRSYGANLGRFLSPEPVFLGMPLEPRSWNLYTYSSDNPLKYKDPNGQIPLLAAIALIGGVYNGLESALEFYGENPDASVGKLAGKFGIGFVAGTLGTAAAEAAIFEGHPILAGGASGLVTEAIDQGLNHAFYNEKFDYGKIYEKGVWGAVSAGLTFRIGVHRGADPYLLKNRALKDFFRMKNVRLKSAESILEGAVDTGLELSTHQFSEDIPTPDEVYGFGYTYFAVFIWEYHQTTDPYFTDRFYGGLVIQFDPP